MEDAFFINSDGARLFAVLHTPEVGRGNSGLVVCHPYGEEKQLAHKVLVDLARELEGAGQSILRFDCRGYGDSEWEFECATLETQVADTLIAIDEFRNRTGVTEIGLLGLRLGGTIAALVAERAEVHKLIMCSPIVRGRDYVEELFKRWAVTRVANTARSREEMPPFEVLSRDGTLEVEGHLLTRRVYDELMAIDLTQLTPKYSGPTFIGGVRSDRARRPLYESVVGAYESKGAASKLAFVDDQAWWRIESLFAGYRPEQLFAEIKLWLGENVS